MFLVVNAKGQYWDGFSWSTRGKEFMTIARALRSLHEEGEDLTDLQILEKEKEYT